MPPIVNCYICGRKFGDHSINIHEKQCLKKWHLVNDNLPASERGPVPQKNSFNSLKEQELTVQQIAGPQASNSNSVEQQGAPQKAPLFQCYLCGKLFSVHSIYVHEPQCLEVWTAENNKLPPHKRKRVPPKEDVKFTPSGNVDFKGTMQRVWENHLNELIPCTKCGRTFFPDRIEKHEQMCNGLRLKIKK